MKTTACSSERYFPIRLACATALLGVCATQAQVITNPPPPPPAIVVSIRAADASAAEPCAATIAADRGVLVVSRETGTNIDLAVYLGFAGNAQNGTDYLPITNRIVIPKGRWAAEIPLAPKADNLSEGVEEAVVRVLAPVCPMIYPPPPECYVVGAASQAVVRIADCDAQVSAVVTIRAADPYATEPCGIALTDPGVFVISRGANTNINLFVNLAFTGSASNGVDYLRVTNRVVIPAGKWAVETPIKPIADNAAEGPESVVARILPPTCVASVIPMPPECYLVGQPAEAVVYIRECSSNRPPVARLTAPVNGQFFPPLAKIFIRAETRDFDGYCWKAEFFAGDKKIGERTKQFLTAPTNGAPVVFEFVWTNAPSGAHALTVRATDNAGAAGVSDPVKIGVGEPPVTNRPPEVSVVAAEPLAIEGTNCWSWSSVPNRHSIATAQSPVYCPTQQCLVWWFTNCGPRSATFVIRRGGPTNQPLRVFYRMSGTATNGVDYETLPGSVSIPAGGRAAEILVVPVTDEFGEPVESVILELAPPPFASPLPAPYVITQPARAAAAIVDSSNPRLPMGPLPDRCFHVGGRAPDGSWFRIERSPDMLRWAIICTNQATQGAVHFVDPDARENARQFYRAVPTEPPAE